jgi:hypothetical protein
MQAPTLTTIDTSPQLPLIVGVCSRAMFDLAEEHGIFERDGLEAYPLEETDEIVLVFMIIDNRSDWWCA